MPNFNHTTFVGRLTRDPEVKFFKDDKCVCNITVAENRKYKKSDGSQQEESVFLDVELWGRTAEIAGMYCKRGSNVLVAGRLKQDNWEDKDGQKRSKLKLNADVLQLLDSKGDADAAAAAPATRTPAPAAPLDGEPPF